MMGCMKLEEEKTRKCGWVYRLFGSRTISRDIGELECICGGVLKSWNGAVIWSKELIKDVERGDTPSAE
jgi:hypothetical protein